MEPTQSKKSQVPDQRIALVAFVESQAWPKHRTLWSAPVSNPGERPSRFAGGGHENSVPEPRDKTSDTAGKQTMKVRSGSQAVSPASDAAGLESAPKPTLGGVSPTGGCWVISSQ